MSALLDDDPDTFLKNDCRAEAKWVMLELSQVARVSRLELSQVSRVVAALPHGTLASIAGCNSPGPDTNAPGQAVQPWLTLTGTEWDELAAVSLQPSPAACRHAGGGAGLGR